MFLEITSISHCENAQNTIGKTDSGRTRTVSRNFMLSGDYRLLLCDDRQTKCHLLIHLMSWPVLWSGRLGVVQVLCPSIILTFNTVGILLDIEPGPKLFEKEFKGSCCLLITVPFYYWNLVLCFYYHSTINNHNYVNGENGSPFTLSLFRDELGGCLWIHLGYYF